MKKSANYLARDQNPFTFFIDEVKKYRDYAIDEKGIYARIFEEEYENQRQNLLEELELENSDYVAYIKRIDPAKTHNGISQ